MAMEEVCTRADPLIPNRADPAPRAGRAAANYGEALPKEIGKSRDNCLILII